ncbi:Nucleotidyltransferase domain protein [Phycisphaerae bacterium RAS1]|nr:Nucleotidyltransferase domain protein [Phycisphaerae bacterium RAS1]
MVPMRDIRAFARRIAAAFKPRRIILFGSYAYGEPTGDSDVDLMVVMDYSGHPARTAAKVLRTVSPPFAVDLVVRSPIELRRRIALNDWFLRDIVTKGRVLHESADR